MSCETRFVAIEKQLLELKFKADLQPSKVICPHFDQDEYPCRFYEELEEVGEIAQSHCACNCYGIIGDCDLLESGGIELGPDGEWVRSARV